MAIVSARRWLSKAFWCLAPGLGWVAVGLIGPALQLELLVIGGPAEPLDGLLLAFRSLAWPSTALGRSSWSRDLGRFPRGVAERVGAVALLGIRLRERGSPESKPVAAPHDQTGTS